MYTLVKYEDNIYYICQSAKITKSQGVIKAKYSDGRRYPAIIIAKNGKLKLFIYLRANFPNL